MDPAAKTVSPDEKEPLAPEPIGETATDEQQPCEDHGVGVHDPLQLAGGGMQLPDESREGDVENGVVHIDDQCRDAHHDQYGPTGERFAPGAASPPAAPIDPHLHLSPEGRAGTRGEGHLCDPGPWRFVGGRMVCALRECSATESGGSQASRAGCRRPAPGAEQLGTGPLPLPPATSRFHDVPNNKRADPWANRQSEPRAAPHDTATWTGPAWQLPGSAGCGCAVVT